MRSINKKKCRCTFLEMRINSNSNISKNERCAIYFVQYLFFPSQNMSYRAEFNELLHLTCLSNFCWFGSGENYR